MMHGKTVVIALLLTGLLVQNLLWFQPAALLPVIAEDLSMSYSRSGLVMSVVCLLAAAAGLAAGIILNRIGLKRAFSASMLLLAAGALGSLVSSDFNVLLAMRILIGIGIGLAVPIPGVAAVSWLNEAERPVINTVYAVLPYVATALNFGLSVRVFKIFGDSWKLTMALPGVILLAVVALWAFQKRIDHAEPGELSAGGSGVRDIAEILRDRQVVLICLAEACDMWGFEFLSTYLVTYLNESGMPLERAAVSSMLFPVAGIIAGLGCGALVVSTGKRKIFTWPMHLLIFVGTLIIVNGRGIVQMAGIFLAGFGNAGWAPALFTMPMEFKDMTARKISLVFSVLFSVGYLAAFISPPVGGFIAQRIGLKRTFMIFMLFAALAAAFTFLMDETHPKKIFKAA